MPKPKRLKHGLTDVRRAAILDAIRNGASQRGAAEAAGVPAQTLNDWLARGRGEHPRLRSDPFWREFVEEYEAAQSEFELKNVKRIDDAGAKGDWRASAWLLERRLPDRWGKQSEQVPAEPQTVEVRFVNQTEQILAQRAAEKARERGETAIQ